MKTTATGVKKGNVIEIDGSQWTVLSAERNFHGRGSGSVKMKVKNLHTGVAVNKNIRSDEVLYITETETIPLQYLYADATDLYFMSTITYEQYPIDKALAGDFAKYLKEGQVVHVVLYEGKAVSMIPPKTVQLKVIESEDAVKGDTSGNAKKPIVLESGVTIFAPLFIKKGETISVNPETGEYLERVTV